MLSKVLVANRGEIALRIIRACRELGIKTVAVYSTADRDSLHVQYADESICIGPPPSRDSYLSKANIIAATEMTDADAIHPGAGFLAEDAGFAEICEACGITFIGPRVKNIELMGNKAVARIEMNKAGVQLIPGSKPTRRNKRGVVETEDEALAIAEEVGYPVIIKAVGGGGGRGIRKAHNRVTLVKVYRTARAEAASAFGNDEVYVEKCIEPARHVEVQILGDEHGNIIHLGERDCSIQRNHQKLLEESPSAGISERLRSDICKEAVKVAKSIGYTSAGTVEFLVDANDKFYFMEMNTRIQVEHPITEIVTGLDLVKQQILIARGEKLPWEQKNIHFRGHSIECRINAEDPKNGFAPSPGRVTDYHVPGGPGVRVDSHVYSGYEVSPHYDSLVAKLITYGANRTEAIERMRRALDEYRIDGIHTTIPFHKQVLDDERFLSGQLFNNFLETFNT